jgi:hypothetical protein
MPEKIMHHQSLGPNIAVVTLVTVQDFRGEQPIEQFICSDAIGHVAAGQ